MSFLTKHTRLLKKNFNGFHFGSLLDISARLLSGGKYLAKNALPVKVLPLVDALSTAQGPNYALAKRMQHWRVMLAYDAGHTVSSNIAPSTATASVVHNRTFAWAYGGMPYFRPMEIFQQETSNAVMAALLIRDICDKQAPGNPANQAITNPLQIFQTGSFHGGVWRCAYKLDTMGEISVLIYFLGYLKFPFLFALLVAIGALMMPHIMQ